MKSLVIEVVNYPTPMIAGDWRMSSLDTGEILGWMHIDQSGLVLSGTGFSTTDGTWAVTGQVIAGTREAALWASSPGHGFEFRCIVSLSNNFMYVKYIVADVYSGVIMYESSMQFVRLPDGTLPMAR